MAKFQFLIQVEDSPLYPVKGERTAWRRVVQLGAQGRLAEHCIQVQKVEETPANWKEALNPRKEK